tara:strand:- start:866 stop:1663 length:798 start_codon:yes stop_codon:yes gene_type:complete
MNMMSNKKMMSKEEYYALMKGQGLTNDFVIEPLWNKYKASFSKSLVSSQQDMLMKQNQNRPPVQIKPNRTAPTKTPDTAKTPPAHRQHLPNPQAPKSAAPHSHTGAPSISQRGEVNPPPPKQDVEHKSAVHTNPPVSGYVPSKQLPVAPVRKPLINHNYMDEKLYIGIQRTQGKMANHANYLQYLRNHGINDTTPHISTQIQVHQNAKGTQSLQKGESDDDYSKGYTQITADQLRAQLAGQSVPERAKNDLTGMSVPDTNVSATM